MKFEKDKETIYVKNIVDYSDYKPNHVSSNIDKMGSGFNSINPDSFSDLSSIDEKILNILNFEDELNGLEDDSGDGNSNEDIDSIDDLDDADLDDELEFICSLGINPKDDNILGIENDSLADYYNPVFLDSDDELEFLSLFDDFVLVEMGFDDMVREVYFED